MKEINNHSLKIEKKGKTSVISLESFMSVYERRIKNEILDKKTRDLVSEGLIRRFGTPKSKKRFRLF